MKKISLSTLTGFLFFSSAVALAQPIQVDLDGRRLQFDQPPAMVGGRLMVPLRGIFEALQAEVLYDGPTRSIKATKGSKVVELTLGSREARIDGRPVFLDVPADTLGGRTMVPLRFVSESLGAEVKWNGATRTVALSGDGGSIESPADPPAPSSGTRPKIEGITHNGTRNLNAGDRLDIVITGDSGGEASFEILGALRPQSVPEVRPGRYETRYTIPAGLEVDRGVLLGRISRGGLESTQEARRTITIKSGSNSTPVNDTQGFSLQPAANSQGHGSRPQFRVVFPQPIQFNTTRMFIDGVDITRNLSFLGDREAQFQPTFDLSQGNHQAEIEATSSAGQRLNQRWSFQVGGANPVVTQLGTVNLSASTGNTGQNVGVTVSGPHGGQATFDLASGRGMPMQEIQPGQYQGSYLVQAGDSGVGRAQVQLRTQDGRILSGQSANTISFNPTLQQGGLTINNLTDGQTVPVNFTLNGQGRAGSQVTVTVSYLKPDVVSVLTGRQESFTLQGGVGGGGNYSIPINLSAVPARGEVTLTVRDSVGSQAVVRRVRRQ